MGGGVLIKGLQHGVWNVGGMNCSFKLGCRINRNGFHPKSGVRPLRVSVGDGGNGGCVGTGSCYV